MKKYLSILFLLLTVSAFALPVDSVTNYVAGIFTNNNSWAGTNTFGNSVFTNPSVQIGAGTSLYITGTNVNGAELVISNANPASWAGLTAQADNGTFGTNYLFMGINNSKYVPSATAVGNTNDSIIEVNGGNLFFDSIGPVGNQVNFISRSSTNGTATTNISFTGTSANFNVPINGNGGGLTNLAATFSTNFMPGYQSSSQFTTLTNQYQILNCPNVSYNQVYTLSNGIWTNGPFSSYVYTNAVNSDAIEFLSFSGIYNGAQLVSSVGGGNVYQAYLPNQYGVNSYANQTNISLANWYGIGNVLQNGMLCAPLVPSTSFQGQQANGTYQGDFYGNAHFTGMTPTVGSPLPPVDKDWNSFSEPVPQIALSVYPALYTLAGITNQLAWCTNNGVPMDTVNVDITFINYTNGVYSGYITNSVNNINVPGGLTNLIANIHSYGTKVRLPLERYNIGPGLSSVNGYNYSTLTNLPTDLTTIYNLGADGVNIDHFNNTFVKDSRLCWETEFGFPQVLYNTLQQLQSCTNWLANGASAQNIRPFTVMCWGLSKLDYVMNTANEYDIADLFISGNGTTPVTGAAAEAQYVMWVNTFTNFSSYVRPGHFIFGGDIDTSIGAADATNSFSLLAMFSASFGITTIGGGLNGTGTSTNISNALKNSDLMGILKDPACKMAYSVTKFLGNNTAANSTNTEMWVKPRAVPYQYTVMLWNHNPTNYSTVTFTPSQVNSALSGNVLVHSLWQQADLYITNSITVANIAPLGMWLLTLTGNQLTGDGSGLTNLQGASVTGTLPLSTMAAAVVTNTASGLTLSGTFIGNGGGLTNCLAQAQTYTLIVTTNWVSTNSSVGTPYFVTLTNNAPYTIATYTHCQSYGSDQADWYAYCTNSASAGYVVYSRYSLVGLNGSSGFSTTPSTRDQNTGIFPLSSTGTGQVAFNGYNRIMDGFNNSGANINNWYSESLILCVVTNAPVTIFYYPYNHSGIDVNTNYQTEIDVTQKK